MINQSSFNFSFHPDGQVPFYSNSDWFPNHTLSEIKHSRDTVLLMFITFIRGTFPTNCQLAQTCLVTCNTERTLFKVLFHRTDHCTGRLPPVISTGLNQQTSNVLLCTGCNEKQLTIKFHHVVQMSFTSNISPNMLKSRPPRRRVPIAEHSSCSSS